MSVLPSVPLDAASVAVRAFVKRPESHDPAVETLHMCVPFRTFRSLLPRELLHRHGNRPLNILDVAGMVYSVAGPATLLFILLILFGERTQTPRNTRTMAGDDFMMISLKAVVSLSIF